MEVHRGPGAVRAFLSDIYEGRRRYAWRWTHRWVSIDERTAWFVAAGDETVEEEGGIHTIPYCLPEVAVWTTAGWRLRLLHGSEDSRLRQDLNPGRSA